MDNKNFEDFHENPESFDPNSMIKGGKQINFPNFTYKYEGPLGTLNNNEDETTPMNGQKKL